MQNKNVLTVNAGSSSIKLDLFLASSSDLDLDHALQASITGIGQSKVILSFRELSKEKQTRELTIADQADITDFCIQWLNETVPMYTIAAIGHRVVHGGPHHSQPEPVTDELEDDLRSLAAFDPEHGPAALRLIHALRKQFPNIPQVACFDTAFFHDMPRVAKMLALPRKFEAQGLRRYGFHGLSYTYLLSAFRATAGEEAANGRIILAHLGSGASLAATYRGKPVDTTMSFTPASGIMMSSRSGDLDPGIMNYLQQAGMSAEAYTHMVNFESGLLGVSELSADMYTLLQNQATNAQAAEAITLFVYQVKKAIGSLSATLGGLDSLIFTGGIGEQSTVIRERIGEGLGYLGIELDKTSNEQQGSLISSPHSHVGVHVIHTNEAEVIAKQVIETLDVHKV